MKVEHILTCSVWAYGMLKLWPWSRNFRRHAQTLSSVRDINLKACALFI